MIKHDVTLASIEADYPTDRIELQEWEIITDVPKFFKTYFAILKANTKKVSFVPYWDRLLKAYTIVKEQNVK